MLAPYTITPAILTLVGAISEKIGEANANHFDQLPAEWRKSNRIKTIQSALEIDGNTLSADEIASIFENKEVSAGQRNILAVKNAIAVYNRLHGFNPASLFSFLRAHKRMMAGLMESPGKIRTRPVQVVRGDKTSRFPPNGKIVKALMAGLFHYLKNSADIALIKSCVFQYELDFIHPFEDGNGRVGRLWQTVILKEEYPVFEFLPLESKIRNKYGSYCSLLCSADWLGKSTAFIEFMLGVILESLEELLSGRIPVLTAMERIERFRDDVCTRAFSRKDYLTKYKDISTATASRDLREGVANNILEKTGDKRMTSYRFASQLRE